VSALALDVLLADGVIDRVVGRLKSGKEADIYLVEHAGQIFAAKVYKERIHRSFKHNAGYKEGRSVRNTRTQRAIDRGTSFGVAAAEEAWKSAEADALFKLHSQGIRVPKPNVFYEGVLVMELVTDAEGRPASRLIDSPLTPTQASQIYADLRRQVAGMLCCEVIHGDLSAYNVLLGHDGPTLIDFPQVVGAAHNSQAEALFRRDIENVRRFLSGFDSSLAARSGDAGAIWRAYVRRDLTPDFVPTEKDAHASPGPPSRQLDGGRGGHARNRQTPHVKDPRAGGADSHGRRGQHGHGQRQPGGSPHGMPSKHPGAKPAPLVSYLGRPPPPQTAPSPSKSTTPDRHGSHFRRRRRR
jgi:RIO kinase 1